MNVGTKWFGNRTAGAITRVRIVVVVLNSFFAVRDHQVVLIYPYQYFLPAEEYDFVNFKQNEIKGGLVDVDVDSSGCLVQRK